MATRAPLLSFICLLGSSACGSTSTVAPEVETPDSGVPQSQDDASTPDEDAGAVSPDSGVPSADGGPGIDPKPTPVGTWVQTQTLLSTTNVAGFQTTNTVVSIARYEVRATEDPAVFSTLSTPCSVTITTDPNVGVETVIPQTFIDGLVPAPGTLRLDNDGVSFRTDDALEVRGVRLDNPATDPLPDDAEDARVFDQDLDGNPGMTVQLNGLTSGDLYIVQRGVSAFEGRFSPDAGLLEGQVRWSEEQKTLASNPQLLAQFSPGAAVPNVEDSRVRMVRTDDNFRCGAAQP